MAPLAAVVHMDCTAAESPPWHTCDKGKEGFTATSSYREINLTAWRKGSAMMTGKQVGRAMSLPHAFSAWFAHAQ